MSYLVANSITLSKDLKTFRVKGGDNNVVPRSNYWSDDIDIEKLFYNVNGGMIQIRNKTERALCIQDTVFSNKFDGDYYDMYNIFRQYKNKEKLLERIGELRKNDSDYYKSEAEKMQKYYNEWGYRKAGFDTFNRMFLKSLEDNLKNRPKGEYVVVVNSDRYLGKKVRGGYVYYHDKQYAKKYGYYRG